MADRADALREFHIAYGVPVRDVPTEDLPEDERRLRAGLVLEEALEYVEAMGCRWNVATNEIEVVPGREVDLLAAADALADITYVTEGSAVQMGIDLEPVFVEVHRSNMSKLDANGKPLYRESDRKVLKGPHFFAPDLVAVLREQGWEPDATAAPA